MLTKWVIKYIYIFKYLSEIIITHEKHLPITFLNYLHNIVFHKKSGKFQIKN